ncbi:glycosyltransferase family 2 protein [Candidatus Binatia bacterium]|nr:glycosyltransferase family 2 protein [Candidatus Binatia bacterium]
MKVSVVFGTYNRAELLRRSLDGYLRQRLPVDQLEIIAIDDWSTDDTGDVLADYARRLRIVAIRPPWKEPGTWRDSATILNIGLRAASGELVVSTHPEVIPGLDSLRAMHASQRARAYHACKAYYLNPAQQAALDTVDWRASNLALRALPGFYDGPADLDAPENAYAHAAMDRHRVWESLLFGGMTRDTWRWFGGLREFEGWGSVDVDFLHRRQALGMENVTELGDETICIHQNHDVQNQGVVRDVARAIAAVPRYDRPQDALLANL